MNRGIFWFNDHADHYVLAGRQGLAHRDARPRRDRDCELLRHLRFDRDGERSRKPEPPRSTSAVSW
jgi:hypothetical protein